MEEENEDTTPEEIGPLTADFTGSLKIGEAEIPCAVLRDGTRVLSENGITNALLGSRSGASKRLKAEGSELPLFLAPPRLEPFISEELRKGLLTPIEYKQGDRVLKGYDADILPQVCDVWLQARQAGALQEQQLEKAMQAEILMRGLAHVGVVSLVDEATGYQDVRDRLALQQILDRYLKDEWSTWTKRFPDQYYKELFRLNGMRYPTASGKKPSFVGHWTNDIVYSRLAPGLVKKLKEMNPRAESGERSRRHHQYLTEDLGVPELEQHIKNLIFLMKSCSNYQEFLDRLEKASPKFGDTIPLDLPSSN